MDIDNHIQVNREIVSIAKMSIDEIADLMRQCMHNVYDLKTRYNLLQALNNISDEALQVGIYDIFKHDKALFLGTCCIAHNPRTTPKELLFRPFGAQKRYIVDVISKFDSARYPLEQVMAIEKSRDVGATNTMLLSLLHSAIFWGHSSKIITREESFCDKKGDHNALLERIRHACKFVPLYLLPDKKQPKSKHLVIPFGSSTTITGDSAGSPSSASSVGRGSRVMYAMFDECGFWDSTNFELAMTAMANTATIQLLISSASNHTSHYFNDIVDGKALSSIDWTDLEIRELERYHCKPRNNGIFIEFWSNELNTKAKYEALKNKLTPRQFAQEMLGERGGNTPRIFITTHQNSYINPDNDKNWDLQDKFIQDNLKHIDYAFTSWDGGAGSNNLACVIGLHIGKYNRDILIKEFINLTDDSGSPEFVEPLAKRVRQFLHDHFNNYEQGNNIKHYGDPALDNIGIGIKNQSGTDKLIIESVLGCKLDLLHRFRERGDYKPPRHLAGIYANRAKARIQATQNKLAEIASDGMPSIIILGGANNTSEAINHTLHGNVELMGCPVLMQALFKGSYQYRKDKSGYMDGSIDQNHPYCDLADAYTYSVLCREPLPNERKAGISSGVLR